MQPAPARRKPGRPSHQPTAETRAAVVAMVGEDRAVSQIAIAMGLSEPTLRAHYALELASPRPQKNFAFADSGAPKPRRAPTPRAGRPEHVPTDESREKVEILVAGGLRVWQIAAALRIAEPTLRQHYPEELDAGRSRRTAEILEAMFQAARSGNVSAMKGFLAQSVELNDPPPAATRAEPLGKKEAAQLAAMTAAEGTDWDKLLPN